jgi:predicted phage gp36 major capsid-like protein
MTIRATASVIDAAHQLLAEFRARGTTPALWLIDAFTLEEIKDAATAGGAYLFPSTSPHATFMGLPFKSGSDDYAGLELLSREAAVAGRHMLP